MGCVLRNLLYDSFMVETVNLPYGKLPPVWSNSHVIEQIKGTRWYVEKGTMMAFRHWMNEVHKFNPGDLIPMQWATQFIGISRPAIRKRALAGNLTVFSFSLQEPVKTLLGRTTYRENRSSFDYLIKSECEAWRDELFEKREEDYQAFIHERRNRGKLPRAHKKKGRK